MKQIVLFLMIIFAPLNLWSQYNTFSATTKEGIKVYYGILDEKKKTCQVGNSINHLAIDAYYEGPLTIPSEVNGYKVVDIRSDAFGYCDITSITLPNSLESISSYAFQHCEKLESIELPDNVQTIEDLAFLGCKKIETVNIPSQIQIINRGVFSGCESLLSIELPRNLNEIKTSAFENCKNLLSIDIPSQIQTIEMRTFYGCSSLESIVLPNNINEIKSEAFGKCDNLNKIEVLFNNPITINY